jgi:NACHT domain
LSYFPACNVLINLIVDDRACIDRLHYAEDVSASESKKCLPGTRVALLEQIQVWALNPTGQRALLLHGAAGKGKSAIVHTVAIALESLGVAVVPFFAFNRSAKDRSLSQLIPTWAKQLAESNPPYLRYLHSLLPKQLESSDILTQRDLVIKGLASIDDKVPLIFTIDALDECPAEDADILFSILRKLLSSSELPRFVRFLFTFRPDKSIISPFSDLPVLSLSIDNVDGTAKDIRIFVKDQLVGTDLEYMIDDVTNASQTLFQCAAVLCRELKSARGPKLTSVRRKLLRRVREAPGLPLYATYHAILKIHFDERDGELLQLFRRVMSWIFLVRSPQPRRVLQAFAAVLLPVDEQSDVDEILAWLGSLLSGTMPGDYAPISPLHTSLRDFLLDTTESRAFSIDLGNRSQEEIAWACLRIMNTGLEFNICKLQTSFALNSQIEDLPQRVKEHISPGLRYACVATAQHLRSALPPSTTINRHLNTAILHRPSTKVLVGIARAVLVYMSTSLAFLFLAVVLKFFYHDQGKVSAPARR